MQERLAIQLKTQFEVDGEIQSFETQPVAVESVMTFDDPGNSDYSLVGEIEDGKIVVKPDDRVLDTWPQWAGPPKREDLRNCVVTLQAATVAGPLVPADSAASVDKAHQEETPSEDIEAGRRAAGQVKLTLNDAGDGDNFGTSVAISGDTAVIGAVNRSLNFNRAGSAYVFRRNGTKWTQEAKLSTSEGTARDRLEALSL